MSGKINLYGDASNFIGGGWGTDIASQRFDELDRLALGYANQRKASVIYDVGCGLGSMALKFVQNGHIVFACDINPVRLLHSVENRQHYKSVRVIQADAREVDWSQFSPPDIVFSQRFLHYLRFFDAIKLLKNITNHVSHCRLYLSMSGLGSELGEGYPNTDVVDRFATLSDKMSHKHGISQPVCLYGINDAVTLANECGFSVLNSWLSEFGNVKIIMEKKNDQ